MEQQDVIDELMPGMRELVAQVRTLQEGFEFMRTQGDDVRAVLNDFLRAMDERP
jgi:hypothetical protein